MPQSLALQKGERVRLTAQVPVSLAWTSSWIHATDGRVVLLFGSRMGYGGGWGMGCRHGHCCTLLANAVPPFIVPVVGVRLDVHLQPSSARMGVLAVAQDVAMS